MGYMRHHAIVVTSVFEPALRHARTAALRIFSATTCYITPITSPGTNGYRSFLISPDGSKEYWEESEAGNEARAAMLVELARLYEIGEYCDWVEVQFGDEEREAKVTASGDEYLETRTEA